MAKTQLKKKPAKQTIKTVKKATKTVKTAKKTVAKKAVKVAAKPVKKVAAKKIALKKAPAKKVVAKKVAVKKAAAKAPVRGTKKVSVSKAKSPKANVVVKKAVAPQALAPKSQVKPVDRKAGPVMLMQKPLAPRPTLVTNAPKPVAPVKGVSKGFAVNEYVVYPTHGVGKITALEVETIGEHQLKVFVIVFEKDKMTLRVPVGRAEAAGLRAISPMDQITRALSTLKGRAKIARGMWSRRAQEYESKINSGNLVAIAEVVRDLHKNVDQSERSYSERMIYETALHRLVGEVAAAERGDVQTTQDRLLKVLRKQAA